MEKERGKGKGLDALPPMFLVEEHAGITVLINRNGLICYLSG